MDPARDEGFEHEPYGYEDLIVCLTDADVAWRRLPAYVRHWERLREIPSDEIARLSPALQDELRVLAIENDDRHLLRRMPAARS